MKIENKNKNISECSIENEWINYYSLVDKYIDKQCNNNLYPIYNNLYFLQYIHIMVLTFCSRNIFYYFKIIYN